MNEVRSVRLGGTMHAWYGQMLLTTFTLRFGYQIWLPLHTGSEGQDTSQDPLLPIGQAADHLVHPIHVARIASPESLRDVLLRGVSSDQSICNRFLQTEGSAVGCR